jgi:hypothetical protein
MDLGTWMVGWSHYGLHDKPTQLFLPLMLLKFAGYSTKAFCFSCVAWQGYMCMDKYMSQPLSTNVAYLSNPGSYPTAISFCKQLNCSNMNTNDSIKDGVFGHLLSIDAQIGGGEEWIIIYDGFGINETFLPTRQFVTFSFNENTFKYCLSFQLSTEALRLSQLRFKYTWIENITDLHNKTNLQVFLHSSGAFEMVKYELPMKKTTQRIFQLNQETMSTVSTSELACSSYEKSSLDLCLHRRAMLYVRDTVGCTTELIRYSGPSLQFSSSVTCLVSFNIKYLVNCT